MLPVPPEVLMGLISVSDSGELVIDDSTTGEQREEFMRFKKGVDEQEGSEFVEERS